MGAGPRRLVATETALFFPQGGQSIDLTWALIRNADSQDPPQSHCIRICICNKIPRKSVWMSTFEKDCCKVNLEEDYVLISFSINI